MMLGSYVKPHKKRIVINAVIKMTGTLLEVVMPTILAYMINTVVPQRNQNAVIFWGIIMILLAFGAWIGNITANRMASRTASTIIQNVRSDLFQRSMRLSARQIDRITISSLESRLTTDTYNVHQLFGSALRMGIRSVMLFLGGVVFCFVLSWELTLVLILLSPLIFFTVRGIVKKGIPLFHNVQLRVDDMVQVIRENIRGIKVSKALDKTEYEKERYEAQNKAVQAAEIAANDRMALMQPSIDIILFGGLALVMIAGAYLAKAGRVQAGTVMAFMSYFMQITMSLLSMNRMFNMYNRAAASADRIEELLNMPLDENQVLDDAGILPLPAADPRVPEVEFRNVSFSYLSGKINVSNLNFTLYPGQTLGIMGPTGAGKSTIIRLLLRQYDPDEGEILIRGVNIRRLSKDTLLPLFGTVFQNDFLFGGSVRKNIDFGRGLSDRELIQATQNAQAAEFLQDKDGGLDFLLASKGVNLSGGQKQRLLLSRALAGKPEILILDDSSSALDFRTEANLRRDLAHNFIGVTQIIIAQRISSVRQAELIIYVEEGKIVAQGTHEEMLETCPPYREIAGMQMGPSSREKKEFVHA